MVGVLTDGRVDGSTREEKLGVDFHAFVVLNLKVVSTVNYTGPNKRLVHFVNYT